MGFHKKKNLSILEHHWLGIQLITELHWVDGNFDVLEIDLSAVAVKIISTPPMEKNS